MATQGAVLWSTTAATNATVDPAVNFAEGQAPSSLNDSNRGAMAGFARWRNDVSVGTVTGGTSTAYTLVTNATFASLAAMDGALLCFAVHTANGAAPTLNVDGLGAKNLVSATGVTLAAGVFSAGTVVLASYLNSASEFRVVGAPIIPDASISTAKLADDAVTYAKMQNVAAVSLIGNATAGSTNPTGITLGTGLAFSGSVLTVGGIPTVQNLTSGTSYTPTAGARWLKVRMVGGGGGGAGTTGAGGTGGTSSFDSNTAIGGTGGAISSSATVGTGGLGGTGGTDSSGTVTRFPGNAGGSGLFISQSSAVLDASRFAGGGGGDSPFGGAATSGVAAIVNSGSGGGGANGALSGSSTADTGGGGGSGEYVEIIIVAGSYTYAIGAAGAAGTGGTAGAGGTGRIVVEEYYS